MISYRLYWALCILAVFGLPIASFFYLNLELASGILPSTADSIAIPMFGNVVFSAMIAPLVFGLSAYGASRTEFPASWFGWDNSRPLTSWMVSSVCAVPFLGLISLIGYDCVGLLTRPEKLWFGGIFTAYAVVLAVWLAAVRAALVAPGTRREQWSKLTYLVGMPFLSVPINFAFLLGLSAATIPLDWEKLAGTPDCSLVRYDSEGRSMQPLATKCPRR